MMMVDATVDVNEETWRRREKYDRVMFLNSYLIV